MAKGIPGLRDIWDSIGWVKDQVGDALGDLGEAVISPFVDSDGDLFGLIGINDLKSAYKKRKARETGSGAGGSFMFDTPEVGELATSQYFDVQMAQTDRMINSMFGRETYPNQAFQDRVQGIDTSQYIEMLTALAKSQETNFDLNNLSIPKKPQGPNIPITIDDLTLPSIRSKYLDKPIFTASKTKKALMEEESGEE